MKKAIFILCLSTTYLVSCGNNEEQTEEHSHDHGEHDHGDHDHGADEHHDHEEGHDHDQEEFVVEDDSLIN